MVALAYTIGFGWTVLLLLARSPLGLALAGSQVTRQIQRLQSGLTHRPGRGDRRRAGRARHRAEVVPGLVTSVLGLLLLLPPTRALARPAVAALAAARLGRMPLGRHARRGELFRPGRGDYIDGEVIDVDGRRQPPSSRPTSPPTRQLDHTARQRPGAQPGHAGRHRDGGTRRRSSPGWAPTTSAARSSPTPGSSTSTAASSRPAFVDSHVHLTATGLTVVGLDLREATSLRAPAAARRRLRTRAIPTARSGHTAGTNPAGRSAPRRPPPIWTASLGSRPAYLARVDVHSAAASTALRRLVPDLTGAAGLRRAAPLTAEAHHLVRAAPRGPADRRAAARGPASPRWTAAAASGIVAVHECAGPDIGGLDDWHAVRALDHGVEVVGYWGEAVTTAGRGARPDRRHRAPAGWRATCSSTARWARAPRGCTSPTPTRPSACGNSLPRRRRDRGAPERVHRSGRHRGIPRHRRRRRRPPSSTRSTASSTRFGQPAVARCGHRLEHLEMVTDEQAARLGRWGVIASVQPNFDALWGGEAGMYAQRLGVDRARKLNPFALLASQGVPLAFGSDTPGHQHQSVGDGARRDAPPDPGQRDLGAGGVRGRHPWGLAGGRGARRDHGHAGARRARVLRGVGRAGGATPRGRRARRRGAALVHRSARPGARVAAARRRRCAARRAGRRCTGASSSMADAGVGATARARRPTLRDARDPSMRRRSPGSKPVSSRPGGRGPAAGR